MEVIPYLASQRETEAVGAIVLHRLRDRHVGVYHPIEDRPSGGAPMLGPGQVLTHDAARDFSQRLSGGGNLRQILPASVLVADSDLLVWHLPAMRRPIIFQTHDKQLNADVSGRPVLHPPLLFVARPGRIAVYVLASGDRPGMDTPLFRAPYFNLYPTGSMCEGNVPLPPAPTPTEATLAGYEAAFYDSAFVHTNLGHGQLIRWQGGHAGFWRDMLKPEYIGCRFPTSALVPLHLDGKPLTVAGVLANKMVRVDPDAVLPPMAEGLE